MSAAPDYSEWSVAALRAELRERGLDTDGLPSELIGRLVQDDRGAATAWPRRRASDVGWRRTLGRFVRENAYRDVWLLVISGCMVLALTSASSTSTRARNAAVAAQQSSARADALARQIQQQRYNVTLEGCLAQNARHDATIAALDALYGRRQRPLQLRLPGVAPAISDAFALLMQVQSRANRAPTVLLIDALVPHRDCVAVVDAALGVGRSPGPAPPPILPPAGRHGPR